MQLSASKETKLRTKGKHNRPKKLGQADNESINYNQILTIWYSLKFASFRFRQEKLSFVQFKQAHREASFVKFVSKTHIFFLFVARPSVCMFVCLYLSLSVSLCLSLSACLSVYLSVSRSLSFFLSYNQCIPLSLFATQKKPI